MSGRSVFYSFCDWAYFIKKKIYFKILDVYISVNRALEKLLLHPQGGPDTHNSPHQMEAASKAEQPIFVKKYHFKNYQKLLTL